MSNKAPKQAKPKKLSQKAKEKRVRISPVGILLGIATLIGCGVTLFPHVTPTISDPVDPNNPFSSSITITNTGFITLDSVDMTVGLNQVIGDSTLRQRPGDGPIYGVRLRQDDWIPHDLKSDDKFTEGLDEAFPPQLKSIKNLRSADIAIVVDYQIPLIHLKREKIFPYFARRETNGNFYWYATTLPK